MMDLISAAYVIAVNDLYGSLAVKNTKAHADLLSCLTAVCASIVES